MAARKKKTSSARIKAAPKAGSSRSNSTKKKAKAPKSTSGRKAPKPSAAKKKPTARAPKRVAAKKKVSAAKTAGRASTSRPKKGKVAAGKAKLAAGKAKPSARRTTALKKPKAALERDVARERAAREKAKREHDKEREKAKRDKEREKAKRDKEREKAKRDKERAREQAQREREQERLRKQKEAERERQQKERAAERLAAKKAREEEAARRKAEREAEKLRKIAEREQLRLDLLRRKEEERKQKEAEREAYNKAKEAERVKLRAQKEAARRALEGKVARATKRANRIGGMGRGATARVYRPDSIPNQSGTSRRQAGLPESKFANLRLPDVKQAPVPTPPPLPIEEERPPPPPPQPTPEGVEDRYRLILERMQKTSDHFQREYQENFDMSWIYHDSALEGVVYTYQELKTAIDPNITVVPDSSLQPVCEEIRRHKAAIDWIRDLAEKKRVPVSVDVVKRIYLLMHPEEGDLKSVKYRKDIPQHRLYFHEYAAPDKIAYKVRQAIDWLNGPEPKKLKSPVRIAARVHYDLLRVFPFPIDSGKVARLLMNLLLLRAGYPPAIVHSTERQRYYDALKGSLPTIITMVNDSISNGLASIEKLLDDYERKGA